MARPQPQPTKSKAHKTSDELQVERLHKGYAQSMEITKVLADEKSRFHTSASSTRSQMAA